jgi:hypothetical protein
VVLFSLVNGAIGGYKKLSDLFNKSKIFRPMLPEIMASSLSEIDKVTPQYEKTSKKYTDSCKNYRKKMCAVTLCMMGNNTPNPRIFSNQDFIDKCKSKFQDGGKVLKIHYQVLNSF